MTKTKTVKYTKTVEQQFEVRIPDYFSYDDTALGRVVDVLLEDGYNRRTGEYARTRLYSSDGLAVEGAINDLREAYAKASKIVSAFNGDYKPVWGLQTGVGS